MRAPDSERLARLAEGLRHVHVKPPTRPGGRFSEVYVRQGEKEVKWFSATPLGGHVYIPLYIDLFVPVDSRDFGRILREAEEAIDICSRAAAIVGDRAAEVLAQPLRHQTNLNDTSQYQYAGVGVTHLFEVSDHRVAALCSGAVVLKLDGGHLLHERKVWIFLDAFDIPDEEVELLRQLAKDLAEIFDAPKIRKLRRVGGLLVSGIGSSAEVWSATTRVYLVHPPVSEVPRRSTGR